ncbi:MAG TPA: outer membrane lipoprotein-sorting protein [Candidatus Binatia bacterium]|nr:outer membrane lipoprotein-sorting protein [Candidatus Binatia bacterium]
MRVSIPERLLCRLSSIAGQRWAAKFFLALILCGFAAAPQNSPAADADLKPGEVISGQNWQRIQGMVGENFLNRVKAGHKLQIKEPKVYRPLKEYVEATEKYSGKVGLGPNGELLNYVAGQPFPKIDPSDPQIGQKLAWNFFYRWLGDDYKTGGAVKGGKIIRAAIEKDGSERRADLVSYFLFPSTRYSLNPKPALPGYEHIDYIQLRVDSYPRDASGTTTLEIRYKDPKRADDLYMYVPTIRRIRRLTTTQRCQTLAPSEFSLDDINSFNGKITDFNYKYLGDKRILANISQEQLPFNRKPGDYLPLDEKWHVVDTYTLEITPKDPEYCYPKKILHLNKVTYDTHWTLMWDKRGEYWKEQFGFFTPVKLADGREAWSVGDVVIVNVQNGRSTIVTATRAYNQGYPASMFSLATLQSVMRGGSIE